MLRNVSINLATKSKCNAMLLLCSSNEKKLKSLEWRRQYKIDDIRDDFKPPDVLRKYFSAGLVGRDKLQSPCIRTSFTKNKNVE